jgi:hypothetical protein
MMQWLRDQVERTTMANVVAAAVILISSVYAYRTGDVELLKSLCLISAGYLFGVSAKRGDVNG